MCVGVRLCVYNYVIVSIVYMCVFVCVLACAYRIMRMCVYVYMQICVRLCTFFKKIPTSRYEA